MRLLDVRAWITGGWERPVRRVLRGRRGPSAWQPEGSGGTVNTSAKGRKREYRSMRLLESLGYRCVRSAASLGTFDLVAIGPTDILLVQTKANRWPSPEEIETMRLFRAPANARKIVHVWKDHARAPMVKEI